MINKLKIPKNYSFILMIFLTTLIFSCTTEVIDPEPETPITEEPETPITEEEPEETSEGTSVSTVSYYNDLITFHFPESYTVGQYANGDYWVYNDGNGITITQITPVSQNVSGRIINGTMLNPENSENQGYDSNARDMGYEDYLNVDPGNTNSDLTVSTGTSIIKSISTESSDGRPIISDAAILTVVAEIPFENSFRPPYTGSNKTVVATVNDLNFDTLGTYPRLTDEHDIEEVTHYYEKVWLEHNTAWTSRDIHPANHMPPYGRDLANKSAIGLILLQLDYTNEEKKQLLINLVQYGLDIYGLAQNGAQWNNSGGHNLGRKMPLLLAGKVLENDNILAYGDKEKHFIFQDDQQHFYVSEAEVAITNSDAWRPDDRATLTPYTADDIGLAEWGIHHADEPEEDNANWGATYRKICGYAQTSHILAARLMDIEDEWNWSPVFDYTDRFYEAQSDEFEPYIVSLWEAYR